MTQREAARIILRDERGRVLLLRGSDPDRPGTPSWWITPGGGLQPGESHEQAARRELREETGLTLDDVDGPVFEHTVLFDYAGRHHEQHELFFTATVAVFAITHEGRTELERHALNDERWWSAEELRATAEAVYPTNLAELIG